MASGYTAMIGEIDLWRCAKQIVDRYGEDAPLETAMRADAMLEAGDLDGERVWIAIKRRVEEMLSETPGGAVH